MALIKKDVKLRKMEQRLEHLKKVNPELARKLEGKIAAFKAKKN